MMMRSRQRLWLAIAVILLLVLGGGIWLGLKAKRAADDVAAMVVPTRVLPTVPPTATVAGTATAPTAPPATPTLTPIPEPDAPLNILLMGYDKRGDQIAGRTDAMLVVHIDPKQHRAALLSFPRDLWVKIPGYGEERINAAFLTGELQIGEGYGPELAKQTVSELLGIPIQHFVLIDLEGFRAIVDKIGGITLNVPQAIDDPAYPTDDYQTIAIHFDAGCQTLDGERALQYARTRHQDSDFGRNKRQQAVLMAIFNKVRTQGLLSSITSVDEYTDILKNYIRTDIPVSDMLGLARVGAALDTSNIHRYAIDSKSIVMLDAPATFAADPETLTAIVGRFTGELPDPTAVPQPETAPEPTAATTPDAAPASTAPVTECQ